MRILVFATDLLPFPGVPTSGTALRTHGIVSGLRAHGHEVVVSVPRTAIAGFRSTRSVDDLPRDSQRTFREIEKLSFDSFNQGEVVCNVDPDVIICGHWPAMTMQVKPTQTLIIDLAGPHLLERHYQGSPDQDAAVLGKLANLATADYYIVSGPSQKLYFLSYLLRAGVRDAAERMITITMPLDPEQPERSRPTESTTGFPHFIFGGVFLPWQDPSEPLHTTTQFLEQSDHGSLTMIGGKHPNYDVKGGHYEALFDELSKSERVTTKPMMPLDDFIAELCNADVALDLMAWNLERELAVTIRTTTYLWAGVPIIYNDFADLGLLVRKYDAGWCVDPSDSEQLNAVLDEIAQSPKLVVEKSKNASRLAREEFAWDRAVTPLLELLADPPAVSQEQIDIILDFPENAEFPVYGPHLVQQFFVCRAAGFSRIECRIATHDREPTEPLTIRLYEVGTGVELPTLPSERQNPNEKKWPLITEQVVEPELLCNNEWFPLSFDALPNSRGKVYLLELEANKTHFENSISPWAVKSSPYPLVGFYYGDKRVDHISLCLRTTCSTSQVGAS